MNRVEVVRQIIGRFNAGRYDEIPELLRPDIEIEAQSSLFAGKPFRGYDGFRAWIAENLESFDEWSVALDEVVEHPGQRVLAIGTVHARGRESGAALDLPCAWIFEFDGELATRMETFVNRVEEARSAAQLAP
jgi:ketosteroid isomerase-like protein